MFGSVCAVYAFLLAPNQTPTRDLILVKLIVGASQDDTFVVNQVFFRWAHARSGPCSAESVGLAAGQCSLPHELGAGAQPPLSGGELHPSVRVQQLTSRDRMRLPKPTADYGWWGLHPSCAPERITTRA